MANYFICLLLQRLLLPLILIGCFVFRPVGLSFPYLLLFFYLPLVPVATPSSMKGHTGHFLKTVIAISVLISLIQISFQIVLVSITTNFLEKCELLEMIFRHIGLVKLDHLSALYVAWWILPEIIMLITSVILFIALRKISLGRVRDIEENESENLIDNSLEDSMKWMQEKLSLISGIGVFLSLFSLLLAATLRPSIPSAVYFVVYLSAGTWWACYRELTRGFAIICRVVMIFCAAHITTFLTYQTPWPQEFLPTNSSIPRYLGFSTIFSSSCENDTDIRIVFINDKLEIDSYLNPLAILFCYYTLAISSSLLLQPKDEINKKKGGAFGQLENGPRISRQVSMRFKKSILKKKLPAEKWRISARQIKANGKFNRAQHQTSTVPNERTPLMRKSTKRLKDIKNEQGTTVIVEEEPEIPLENIAPKRPSTEDQSSGFLDQLFILVENIAGIIYKNSYIFTNILMMTWSIMYHSWLTFVLLIWANILWMIPNQRKAMLNCSPFIVIYAILLLIAQFIYGMDLTEDELPTKVDTAGINLEQIGFIRYAHLPVKALLLKSLFTIMFWITLRQLIQENRQKRQKSTLADMVAPLQVTVGAATADLTPNTENKKSSEFMKKAGILLNSALVKLWIWVVMAALFVSGMAGTKMTGLRIVYMALFLLFIIIFQISWRVWRKFMYGFWIVIIAYAMSILILVYTYQFDGFPDHWYNYLGIPEKLQEDIGLEVYTTKELLFLHLLNPTLVVIMTAIQLHYFHKDFVKIMDIPPLQNSDNSRQTNSSTNYGNVDTDQEDNTLSEDNDGPQTKKRSISITNLKAMKRNDWMTVLGKAGKFFLMLLEYVWLILELHLIKFIMLYAFLLSIHYVCLLHATIVILTVIAVTSRSSFQILVSRIISIFVAILFIAKMIYQVEYIHHEEYDVVCNNTTNPDGINNADWFGLQKANSGLFTLLERYNFYLFIVTLHAVVVFRQLHKRMTAGRPTHKPQIMFPKINRTNAEKNLKNMIMYLFNYGFFKFGLEVCLLSIVALIGFRMDMIACFYALWLVGLFALKREKIAFLWKFFMVFISSALIIQYIVMIGIPPGTCFPYPWDTDLLKNLQKWAMLPDAILYNQVRKLVLDFFVLFFVSRQNLVFRIEERYSAENSEFPGGKNKSIVADIDKHGFSLIENPTPDFTSNIRNWLDILKRAILLGFFWCSLAIVFLTGTNRVNLFSIGYLMGSFIFLWQGSDFYLRPIKNIIHWWTALLGYNVFVISIKCFLQIPGCLFFTQIASEACWLIQLFGITCITKFEKKTSNDKCLIPDEDVGLFWDGICFAFLLLQLRIYNSYYFVHMVNDTKAGNILASRGAQLIEAYRTKQVKLQTEHENEILQKIKQKMDRIKATQQKLMQPMIEPKAHAQERTAPLARSTSMSSCAGYHTPIEDEVVTSIIVEGDGGSDLPSDIGPFTSRGGSFLQTQAPSPSSAIMTVSLDGYLEPQRLSFGSPPGSDMLPRIPSLDESFPVFSPPPFEDSHTTESTQSNTLVPPSIVTENTNVVQTTALQTRQHRRQSSLNTVSWPDQQNGVDMNGRGRRYSTTLNPTDGPPEEQSPVYRPRLSSYRRQTSMHSSFRERRRSSYNSSLANDDDVSATLRTGPSIYRRQSSWGPIGEMYHRESIISMSSRSPNSHHEYSSFSLKRRPSSSKDAIRSGDYYMFEELDNKVDLDILNPKEDAEAEAEDEATVALSRKQTLTQFLQENMKTMQEVPETDITTRRRSSLPEDHVEATNEIFTRSVMSEPITTPRTTTPHRSLSRTDQEVIPQPSTSRGGASDESGKVPALGAELPEEPQQEEEEKKSRLQGIIFIWKFLESLMISLTLKLNRVSRNYRYVVKVLQQEKKTLKSSEGFGIGLKISSALIWGQPSDERTAEVADMAAGTTSTISSGSVSLEVVDSPRKSWGSSTNLPTREATPGEQVKRVSSMQAIPPRTDPKERRTSLVPEIRILAPSLERGLDEYSPYKISPFEFSDSLKASEGEVEEFSSKEHSAIVELIAAIWAAILSHTDFVCYLMVFINQIKSASILSLPLPLMVFFWGTLTIPRPSKTFWITLIAYTQTIVLLKCVSQFELLWWNQTEIPPNQPLAPSRIFGIEKKKGYATYDLILLLVVFFHRFMLKSMGLWKSEYPEEIVPEGPYQVQNGSTYPPDEKKDAITIKDGKTQLSIAKLDPDEERSPNSDDVELSNLMEETGTYFPGVVKLSAQKYASSVKQFFGQVLGPASRVTRDVYAYMFLCDFINFLVLLFGFTSFGSSQGDGGVTAYLEENKVPITFLVMLLLQFVLIIIDRALYLRKYMLGKVVFQYALIVVIHIWMFFILPGVTERNFNARNPPVIWYIIKCFYLLLSAFQIRCGYPTRILGNFLTKGFTIVNVMLHRVFMAIPFLFELRTLMDWIWTDTTMTLFDWLKMEDIFVNIYQQKCSRQMESDFPAPRGIKKPKLVKYLMGGGMLFGLIALIWFPLALFALGNTVGEPNPPFDVTVSLRIGPYEPVYSMSAQDSNIISFDEPSYNRLSKQYSKDRTALTFLTAYEASDITAIILAANSTAIWNISPPDKVRLLQDIESNNTLTCRFKYTVSRKTHSKDNPGIITDERFFELEADYEFRDALASMLQNQTSAEVIFPALFPKFLKVKNAGALKPAPQLLGEGKDEDELLTYRNLSLKLFHSSNESESQMWWEVKEDCKDIMYQTILKEIPFANCESKMVMYFFNDKIFPSTLSWLTAGGIIGMYTTFVILFSRVIRGIFSGMSSKIMFDDLPYVDRVLQLCLDIYLVRESLEFTLEEDLFAKLIFLYRSPETMIKWTRPKDEKLDDDDEEDDDDDNSPRAIKNRVDDEDDDDDDEYEDSRSGIRRRKTPIEKSQ